MDVAGAMLIYLLIVLLIQYGVIYFAAKHAILKTDKMRDIRNGIPTKE